MPIINNQTLKTKKGFTLIELLIVIGITIILAGVSSVIYGNLQQSAQLNETSAQIAQNLRLVQEQSRAGKNNIAHGIKFESTQYTLFQGASYAAREASYDRSYALSPTISLVTTFSENEILFSKGVGAPSDIGEVTISHSIKGSKIISLNAQGVILEQ